MLRITAAAALVALSAPAYAQIKPTTSGSFTADLLSAGACDTSQWTSGYEPGYSTPRLDCYATKQSSKIDIKFPATIGIGAENPNIAPRSSPTIKHLFSGLST